MKRFWKFVKIGALVLGVLLLVIVISSVLWVRSQLGAAHDISPAAYSWGKGIDEGARAEDLLAASFVVP